MRAVTVFVIQSSRELTEFDVKIRKLMRIKLQQSHRSSAAAADLNISKAAALCNQQILQLLLCVDVSTAASWEATDLQTATQTRSKQGQWLRRESGDKRKLSWDMEAGRIRLMLGAIYEQLPPPQHHSE